MMSHTHAEARAVPPGKSPRDTTAARALESLQELERIGASPAQVMKALREAGIHDLEELVRRVIAAALPEPDPLGPFALARPEEDCAAIVHRAPQVAFTVDDVLYDPGDIARFNGKPMHFIVRPAANRDHALVAFVGDDWLRSLQAYFQTVTFTRHLAFAGIQYGPYPAGSHYYPPYHHGRYAVAVAAGIDYGREIGWAHAKFCEHINFKGSRLQLDKNKVWPDLTKVGMGFLAGDWNDKISSVLSDGATLLLFEHIHFGGDTLLIPAQNEGNLVELGWNDRASSIKNFGNIY